MIRSTSRITLGRLREASVGTAVANALGSGFSSVHLGGADEVDCELFKGNVLVAKMEITEDIDEDLQHAAAFQASSPESLVRELPIGYGEWLIQLVPSTRVDTISSEYVRDLITPVVQRGRRDFDANENSSLAVEFETYVEAGLSFMFRIDQATGDQAHLSFGREHDSIFISNERDLYVEYLQSVLSRERVKGKINKMLERSQNCNSWLVIVVGSRASNSVIFRSRGISMDPGLPNQIVEPPNNVAAIWILSEALVPQFVVDSEGRFLTIADFSRKIRTTETPPK